MLRVVELGLFLLPFAIFGAAWWLGGLTPSPAVLALAIVALIGLTVCLIWYGDERSLPAGAAYVPARLVGGAVVPGHGAPR